MGTLKDLIDANIAADKWCESGAAIITDRPDDPSDYYDACDTASGFMTVLNLSNPPKFKAMFLQSLLELAKDLPDGQEKTRITAIGDETANLAAERIWFAANKDGAAECGYLVNSASEHLDGGNTVATWAMLHNFVRARAEVDKIGIPRADINLLIQWKDRCPLSDWANNLK